MQGKVGSRKRARGALPFPNLWSLALCHQSLACHLHFTLASMQKMKNLRRRQVNDPPLPLMDSSWKILPEGGGGFKRFEREKLLLFSQWLVVVYKLNFSQSCEKCIKTMRQGKGLYFQSSSTQVSAHDLGASSLWKHPFFSAQVF